MWRKKRGTCSHAPRHGPTRARFSDGSYPETLFAALAASCWGDAQGDWRAFRGWAGPWNVSTIPVLGPFGGSQPSFFLFCEPSRRFLKPFFLFLFGFFLFHFFLLSISLISIFIFTTYFSFSSLFSFHNFTKF